MATVKEGDHMTREKENIIERIMNIDWYNVSIETLRFIECVIELDSLPEPDEEENTSFVLCSSLPE